jgi:2-amino-4-hydroxy-6-hydroxymethyldihydropteridine diphosphokinase
VGIGSNLGEPASQVAHAFDELDRIPRSRLVQRSSLYRSAPVGFLDQPDFINAVGAVDTALEPEALLDELQTIESRHGRTRAFANAPRSLDLDMLLFGETLLKTDKLVLPHPRMHERAFVLKPLVEIAPDLQIPGRGAARDYLVKCWEQVVDRAT